MKHSITLLLLTLTSQLLLAPNCMSQEKETTQAPIVELKQKFSNLPQKTRKEYGTKIIKVQNLFNQKRIFDALQAIDELDKIFPGHPSSLNIKGACYVEIRAFKKADIIFKEVLRIDPSNTNVQFNLAEVDFVTKKWTSAYNRFTKLIPLLPKRNKPMIRLCEFKLLLCQLKTNREKKALALRDKHDVWDDSPFFYYSRAAVLYHQGEKIKADKMLRNVHYVWRNNNALAPWQDTLIEFGYIRSFYGGDVDEEEEENKKKSP